MYLAPASCRPVIATMKPITPNPSATIARRSANGSRTPIATKDIAPE